MSTEREGIFTKDLRELADKEVVGRWQRLAAELGIPPYKVEAIEHNHRGDVCEQAYRCLLEWSRARGETARLQEVRAALSKISSRATDRQSNVLGEVRPFPIALSTASRKFTGREEDLRKMCSILKPAARPKMFTVLVVHGLGGIGKTELCYQYALREKDHYQNGVLHFHADCGASLIQSVRSYLAYWKRNPVNSVAQDRASFFAELTERQDCLIIFDSADYLEVVQRFLPPENLRVHIIVSSRSDDFPELWANFPHLALDFLPTEAAVSLLLSHAGLNSKYDLQNRRPESEVVAAEELVGNELLGGLPLAIMHAGKHMQSKHMTVLEYLEKAKGHQETVRVRISTLDGWLHYFRLSGMGLFDDSGVSDIEHLKWLSDSDVTALGLSTQDKERFIYGLKLLKSGKLPPIPAWEMDIEEVKLKSPKSLQLLQICSLLAPVPIPVYVLLNYMGLKHPNFFEDELSDCFTIISKFGLLQWASDAIGALDGFCSMHSRVQATIRDFRIDDRDRREYLVTISKVLNHHLPSSTEVSAGNSIDCKAVADLSAHIDVVVQSIVDLNILESSCEDLFEFARTMALVTGDPIAVFELCKSGVCRPSQTLNFLHVRRLLDLAECYLHRRDYDDAQEYAHTANSIVCGSTFYGCEKSYLLCRSGVLVAQIISGRKIDTMAEDWKEARCLWIAVNGAIMAAMDLLASYKLTAPHDIYSLVLDCIKEAGGYIDDLPARLDNFAAMAGDIEELDSLFKHTENKWYLAWKTLLHFRPSATNRLAVARYWSNCAQYLYQTGSLSKARELYITVLEFESTFLPRNHVLMGNTHVSIGKCLAALGDHQVARKHFDKAKQIYQKTCPRDRVLGRVLRLLAKSTLKCDPLLAEGQYRSVLEFQKQCGDANDILSATLDLAKLFVVLERVDEALALVRQKGIVGMARGLMGINFNCPGSGCRAYLLTWKATYILARFVTDQEELMAVMRTVDVINDRELLCKYLQRFSSSRKLFCLVNLSLARSLSSIGYHDDAIRLCRQCVVVSRRCQSRDYVSIARFLAQLAECYKRKTSVRTREYLIDNIILLQDCDTTVLCATPVAGMALTCLSDYFIDEGDQEAAELALDVSVALPTVADTHSTMDRDLSDDAICLDLPWGKLQWRDLVHILPQSSAIDWRSEPAEVTISSEEMSSVEDVSKERQFLDQAKTTGGTSVTDMSITESDYQMYATCSSTQSRIASGDSHSHSDFVPTMPSPTTEMSLVEDVSKERQSMDHAKTTGGMSVADLNITESDFQAYAAYSSTQSGIASGNSDSDFVPTMPLLTTDQQATTMDSHQELACCHRVMSSSSHTSTRTVDQSSRATDQMCAALSYKIKQMTKSESIRILAWSILPDCFVPGELNQK